MKSIMKAASVLGLLGTVSLASCGANNSASSVLSNDGSLSAFYKFQTSLYVQPGSNITVCAYSTNDAIVGFKVNRGLEGLFYRVSDVTDGGKTLGVTTVDYTVMESDASLRSFKGRERHIERAFSAGESDFVNWHTHAFDSVTPAWIQSDRTWDLVESTSEQTLDICR